MPKNRETPSTLAIAREVDRDLRAVRRIVRQPADAEIARGDLTGPQLSAMQALVETEGMSLKSLSLELGLAHSTVSGIVDRLEKRGLIERRADRADGRISKLVVSGRVRRYLRTTWPRLELHPLAEALRTATEAERRAIVDGVRLLRRALEGGQG